MLGLEEGNSVSRDNDRKQIKDNELHYHSISMSMAMGSFAFVGSGRFRFRFFILSKQATNIHKPQIYII